MPNSLGRYEILEELGRGAMGVVYKARDPVLGRIVAIKTMAQDAADDDELRQRLEREAAAAARLKHPNIITVHDYGEENGVPFIAMEFLEGIDLKQIVKNQIPLYPAEKVGILRQVASGLGHAHREGVVHRDVKPANIRILRDGTVKIMDFGIARVASSQLTRVGTVLGSVDYMSPEQVEGKQVDHRADIFSFGVVSYELLTFKIPFKGQNMPSTMRNILEAKMPALDPENTAPFPEIEAVVRKCLQREPSERFDNFQEVVRQLDQLRAGMAAETGFETPSLSAESGTPQEQETVILSAGAPTEGSLERAGDSTISSVQLWADRDRFQKIHDVIERSETNKPKRKPPRQFKADEAYSPRSPVRGSLTNRSSQLAYASRTSPRPVSTVNRGAVLAIAAVFVLLAGVTLWIVTRGETLDPAVSEFVQRQLQSSSTKADQGDLVGALADVERILEVTPNHAEATVRLEQLRLAVRERFSQAMEDARSSAASGDWASAQASAEVAHSLVPDDPDANALLREAQESLRGARERADTSRQLDELIADGKAHLAAGRSTQAITAFQAASTLDPSSEEAERLLREARQAESAKRDAESAYRAGIAALERSDFDEAVRELERATSLDPSHGPARERLAEARRERARPRFGVVTITALPFGEAFLDGENLGTTPVKLDRVSVGQHEVRVVKDGYQVFVQTVDVREGQTTNVVAQLNKIL